MTTTVRSQGQALSKAIVLACVLAAAAGCRQDQAEVEPAPEAPVPPPGVEALLPEDMFAELRALREDMQDAAVGFTVAPQVLHLGDSADARLTITPSLSSGALVERRSPDDAGFRANPRMRADLTAVGASVDVLGSDALDVSTDGDTEWRWLVTPNWEGEIPITVTLFALVMLQGQETPYELRAFDAMLNVTIAPSRRVTLFLAANWVWLWLLAVPPVAAWWFSRKKRHRKRRRRRPSAPLQS
jgi:hypothetical protein